MRSVLHCVSGLTVFFWACSSQAGLMEALTVRVVPAVSDNYILPDNLPAQQHSAGVLRVVAAPDQFEPASFVVYGERPVQQLQVSAATLRDADGNELEGAKVDIRVVKRWYQRNFGYGTDKTDPRTRFLVPELLLRDDSLVEVRDEQNYLRLESGEYVNISKPARLNGFGTPRPEDFPVRDARQLLPVNIAAGDNKQYWVTVYVPPDAAPGTYRAEISLSSAGKQSASLPLELEVLPFSLSKPRIEYSIYYRGTLNDAWPEGSVSSEYKSAAQMLTDFRNLHEHGIRNPTVYQALSSGQLDRVLELRSQAGMKNDKLYYLGVDIAPASNYAKVEEYRALLPGKVNATRTIAKEFGVRDVYFYARDEARDEQLLEQIPFWDVVRKAGGRIMAAGWRSQSWKPGNFAATGGNEDLFNALGMPSRQESANWHGKNKLIYSYQNPTGGIELPETWRRNYGLLLWQYDYDGAMPYAWQHSYGDAWNDFDDINYRDHNFTYPTVDSSIDTLQWEGLRAGVDDSRYLATLLDTLESAAGKASPHALEVRDWLHILKDAPLARLDLSALREQMTGYILALQGYRSSDDSTEESLRIDDLRVGSILSDGSAELTWRTSARATSRIELRDPREQQPKIIESAALNVMHRIRLTNLKPGRNYALQVTSVVPGGDSATLAADVDTNVVLGLDQPEAIESAGKIKITTGVNSSYRASIGIEWQQSLLGWWRFSSANSVAADSSDRNTPASLKSGAVSGSGWFGRGVRLNGAGAFIDASDISFAKNGRGTIEGWFRFRSFAMDNQVNMGIFTGIYQHEGNNQFYFNDGNEFFAAASLLTIGAWHHLALSWDGDAGSARFYVDGRQLMPVLQDAIEDIAATDGLRIGDNTGFLGGLMQRSKGTFDGDVDELRVWSRALSAEEIQAAYDANSARLSVTLPRQSSGQSQWSVIGANAADQIVRD